MIIKSCFKHIKFVLYAHQGRYIGLESRNFERGVFGCINEVEIDFYYKDAGAFAGPF